MTTRAGINARAIVVALLAGLVAASAPAAVSASPATTSPSTAVPAPPGARTVTAPDPAQAGARVVSCRRSALIDERVAVVGAWMRPLASARHLTLRIDLLQRTLGSARWTLRDDVPGLGVWTAPSDALVGTRAGDVFRYRQAVGRLVVPSAYRFRVGFRWLDDTATVVREAGMTTAPCRQPDLRPDFVLSDVQVQPSPRDPSLVRYTLVVSNEGRTASRAVVAATLPGETTPGTHLRTAGRLEPGASVSLSFTGPGCADGAAPALFAADPANAVDEAGETNNQLAASCPAP